MSDGSDAPVLEGRVVVVTEAAVAHAVSDAGAAVVLVSPDGTSDVDDAFATTVTDLEARGRRVARFLGDLGDAENRTALAEMISELFAVDDA